MIPATRYDNQVELVLTWIVGIVDLLENYRIMMAREE
jgi:hypothetical protein